MRRSTARWRYPMSSWCAARVAGRCRHDGQPRLSEDGGGAHDPAPRGEVRRGGLCAARRRDGDTRCRPGVQQELQGVVGTMVSLGYLKMAEVPTIPRREEKFGVAVYAPLDGAMAIPDVVLVCSKSCRALSARWSASAI